MAEPNASRNYGSFFLRFFSDLKSLLNLLQYCFCFKFFFFGPEACGILVPQPGIKPTPPALEGEVLATEPPGKSGNYGSLRTKFQRSSVAQGKTWTWSVSTCMWILAALIKLAGSMYNGYKYRLWSRTAAVAAKSLQSCPTLCDPKDGSLRVTLPQLKF